MEGAEDPHTEIAVGVVGEEDDHTPIIENEIGVGSAVVAAGGETLDVTERASVVHGDVVETGDAIEADTRDDDLRLAAVDAWQVTAPTVHRLHESSRFRRGYRLLDEGIHAAVHLEIGVYKRVRILARNLEITGEPERRHAVYHAEIDGFPDASHLRGYFLIGHAVKE